MSTYFKIRSLSKIYLIYMTAVESVLCFLKSFWSLLHMKKQMSFLRDLLSRCFFRSWHCLFSTILRPHLNSRFSQAYFFFINSNQMIPLYHYTLFMHVCMITVSWRPTKRATNAVWLFLYKPKTAQMFLSQRGYKQSLATALTTLWLGLVIPEWPAAILAWPWPGFLWTCPGPVLCTALAAATGPAPLGASKDQPCCPHLPQPPQCHGKGFQGSNLPFNEAHRLLFLLVLLLFVLIITDPNPSPRLFTSARLQCLTSDSWIPSHRPSTLNWQAIG